MKKVPDDSVCFVVSLKEVKKYRLSSRETVKKNPEANLLFPKKVKGVKNNVSEGNS